MRFEPIWRKILIKNSIHLNRSLGNKSTERTSLIWNSDISMSENSHNFLSCRGNNDYTFGEFEKVYKVYKDTELKTTKTWYVLVKRKKNIPEFLKGEKDQQGFPYYGTPWNIWNNLRGFGKWKKTTRVPTRLETSDKFRKQWFTR